MVMDEVIRKFMNLEATGCRFATDTITKDMVLRFFKEYEDRFFGFEEEIRKRYIGNSILDLDIFGFKYTSKSNQMIELGLPINGLIEESYMDIDFDKVVNLREWIFAILCSCPDIVKYEDEIDSLFVKRMGDINTDIIYKHKEWDIYVQIGRNMTSAVKLSSVLQHDVESLIEDDLSKLAIYNFSLRSCELLNLSMFNIKWGKDIIALFKKMHKDFSEKRNDSFIDHTQFLAIDTLFNLVKNRKADTVSELYNYVFFFGISNLLKKMSSDVLGVDSKDFMDNIDVFFTRDKFSENLDNKGLNLYEYIEGSNNYIKRVIRKGDLAEYGTTGIEPFYTGALLNAYHPLGTSRSDYQFILYYIINQAFNTYNKAPKNHIDTGEYEKAKENMLKAYMLGKRFKFEDKELHDFAVTVSLFLSLIDEMNRMSKLHLCEVVDEVVRLKTTYNKLSHLLSNTSRQVEELQLDIENEQLSRESTILEEKNKLYKDIYKDLRKELNSEIESYKKENSILKKNLETLNTSQEVELAIDIDEDEKIPTVKYTSDYNILVIGDYNLKTTLLESVFSSVKKIDGNNSANLNVDSVLAGVDMVVYQYTFCQHDSLKFTKEASKREIPVVYVKQVNERQILDEIYAHVYR